MPSLVEKHKFIDSKSKLGKYIFVLFLIIYKMKEDNCASTGKFLDIKSNPEIISIINKVLNYKF